VDEHTVGGLALAAVTRYCIAVIEMRMLSRVELDLTTESIFSFRLPPPSICSTVPSSRLASFARDKGRSTAPGRPLQTCVRLSR